MHSSPFKRKESEGKMAAQETPIDLLTEYLDTLTDESRSQLLSDPFGEGVVNRDEDSTEDA